MGPMNICVIGGSKGIGKALVEVLLQGGHHVWCTSRSNPGITRNDGAYTWTQVDLQKPEEIIAWKDAMDAKHFVPDVVICNASVQIDDMIEGFHMGYAEQVIDVNLLGTLRCVEVLLNDMLVHKRGKFVLISSTSALRPSARSASYAASKTGATMAFRTFDLQFAPKGVRFATVTLGPIRTDMWEGKTNGLVPSPEHAARAIAAFAVSSRMALFYPWLTTTLLRLSSFLPDRVFAAVSIRLLK